VFGWRALGSVPIPVSLQDALEKSFDGMLRFGGTTGFVVAATPCAKRGITSAVRTIIVGMPDSEPVERGRSIGARNEQKGGGG